MFLLVNSFIITFVSSCSKEDDTKIPEIKSTFMLKSSQITEFKSYDSGKETNLSTNDIDTYFGNRVNFYTPKVLLLRNDSIVIGKAYGLEEKYKIQWDGNKLSLYNTVTDKWIECGEKTANGGINLYISLYRQETGDANYQLISFGQDYDLTLPNDLLENINTSSKIIWLKINYTFE